MARLKIPAQGERIQKLLANQGFASRRVIERWIRSGRIKVNGQIAGLGERYRPGDQLMVDNKTIAAGDLKPVSIMALMYYKPPGEVTSHADEQGRKTVFDNLPVCPQGRWISVGRLDMNAAGLLLVTNHGELASRLMHPQYQLLRKYAVRIWGQATDQQRLAMCQGVELVDGLARFETIDDAGGKGTNHWYHVTLREGRNHEVKRIWASQRLTVNRLIRIRFADIKLDNYMKAGQYRMLSLAELNRLLIQTDQDPIKAKEYRRLPHQSGCLRTR